MSRSRLLFALLTFLAIGLLGRTLDANADCAADATIAETKRHFTRAQELERAGKQREALAAYVAAQDYTCEANPVELPAAQRAAALALPLAQTAERQKDFDTAHRLYEDGGHYAASDRALIALVRAKQDDPSVYSRAREIFAYRASPAFQSNNKVRLGVTGAYAIEPSILAEIDALPAAAAERAFKAEAAAFNEQYLREYVELIQTRPEDTTDQAAVQRYGAQLQAFHQRWPNDPLAASRAALDLAHAWSAATNNRSLADKLAAKRRERLEQRVLTLTRSFQRAPEFLDAAIDYQMSVPIEDDAKQARVTSIRNQAAQLGDKAMSQQRLGLAAEYYGVARLDAKAERAREQQREAAMAKMQPSIDAMRKQAEELQKAFSDPQKVQEMQAQARAAQQAMQARQQANAKNNAKQADELEKELGL